VKAGCPPAFYLAHFAIRLAATRHAASHDERGGRLKGPGFSIFENRAAFFRSLELAAAARAAANAAAAEALTSILIQINRSGIVSHSGIKIIGQEH